MSIHTTNPNKELVMKMFVLQKSIAIMIIHNFYNDFQAYEFRKNNNLDE